MTSLGAIFDEDPFLYDRARPSYPAAMFDDLAASVPPGARVLEIGAGTGKATVDLAARGYRVTAVELGAGMADVARRNLTDFDNVSVLTASFEDWPLPAEPFDVVLAATAFHWIDPALRYVKSAAALRSGGLLAVVSTHHVKGGTEDFFAAAQDCYERWDPATEPGIRLEPSSAVPQEEADPALFGPSRFFRYEWDADYSRESYLDVLQTYSGHRALSAEARAGLLGCLGGLIDTGHGGRIVKRYMTELRLSPVRLAPVSLSPVR